LAGLSRPTVPDISEDAEPTEETSNVHDAVFGLVQGRLAGLLGKSSGYIESLPDGAKKTIEALKGVQVKQNELHNQYKRECLELEKKVESRAFAQFFFGFFSPSLPLLLS
jgi:nucleosome assembly protein 1-like 1